MDDKGREYEIDLYASDTIPLVFEIKSYAEKEDVERFNDKAELFKKGERDKEDRESIYHLGEEQRDNRYLREVRNHSRIVFKTMEKQG